MDTVNRNSLSAPVGGPPLEKITSPPGDGFSNVIVERYPSTSDALTYSLPHASNKIHVCSRFPAATHATGCAPVSSKDEQPSAENLTAGRAGHEAKQDASPAPAAFSGAAGACAQTMSETRSPATVLYEKPAAVSIIPCPSSAGDICRCGAAVGRSLCGSLPEAQPLSLKPGCRAAHYVETGTTDASGTAEASNPCQIDGAAERPAARVVRVHRLSHQQGRQQRWEGASGRRPQRHVPAVAEREHDAELQQIARQEQEGSDDELGFVMGDIIERSTGQPQHQQELPQSQEVDAQQRWKEEQVLLQVQQQLPHSSFACVSNTAIPKMSQQGSAKRYATVSAPANDTAPAAATTSEGNICERRTLAGFSRTQENVFRERHAAVEAPRGFPQPVHRSVLQQLLDIREAKQSPRGHERTSGERQREQDGEKIQETHEMQQRSRSAASLRSGLRVEERLVMKEAQTPICVVDSDLETQAKNVRSCRFTPAENDRARIEAEAAELLRAMQPHEITAARQELLDRFGPRRFSVLQRRALKRAASHQQGQLAEKHDDIHHQKASAAETAEQKHGDQETASRGYPLVDGHHKAVLSSVTASSSSSEGINSAQSHTATPGDSGGLPDISAASPAALVSFTLGNYPGTEGASAACQSIGAAAKSISGGDAGPAGAAASVPTAPVLSGAGNFVRFDIHEAAKLRWTDPLGPEDWQQGPVGYATEFVENETSGLPQSQLQQQQGEGPRGAHRDHAAATHGGGMLPSCSVASSTVCVKLEKLRFDFDGCLRSDVFHAQNAVDTAVAGVRAAAMHQRRLWKMTSAKQPENRSQHITEKGAADICRQPENLDGARVSFSTGGTGEGARIHFANKGVDTQTRSTEDARARMLQDAPDAIIEETSDESDPLEFHRGLHHHGNAAALPGYTLPELLHLAQSSNQAQASLALQTVAAVIRTGKTLFMCPSIAAAAAFAASLRCWADWQQQLARPIIQEETQPKLRPRETHVGEEALQRPKNTQESNDRVPLLTHRPQTYVTLRQQVKNPTFDCESADEAAVGFVDRLPASSRDTPLLLDVEFGTRAGYGVGLKRWHNYVTRDLHMAWRLHALLHAQATAVHRAALSCLSALFGPPALSGTRRLCAARGCSVASFVRGTAVRGGGKRDGFERQCSSISGRTSNVQRRFVRESECSSSNITDRFSGNVRKSCSHPPVEGDHDEFLFCEQRTQHGVPNDESLSEKAKGVTAPSVLERNVSSACVPKDDTHWGPGWASFPLHMKLLTRRLTRQLQKVHHFDQEHQQLREDISETHSFQDAMLKQNARRPQTLPYNERAAEFRRQDGLKGTADQAEINYVCIWSLGGLDFLSEGLSVLGCCSRLHSIGSHHNIHLSYAGGVGEDSSAGCRGVFAFWHAFFGRMFAEATGRPVNSHQLLQQAANSMRPTKDGEWLAREDEKPVKKEGWQSAESALASVSLETINMPEHAAACKSAVRAREARRLSVTKSEATVENDSCAPPTVGYDELRGTTQLVPSEKMPEDILQSRRLADARERGESMTAFCYESVGALFSSNPAEAMLGCGSLLDRLTLLLTIYSADEDVERNAIQLLIGLSVGGPASIAYMLTHAPLQKRVRSLAEELLIGTDVRFKRVQRQKRHTNLAVATFRAAADSRSSSAAGVYFVARAELDRQMDYSTKKSEWNKSSLTRGSGKIKSSSGLCGSQNGDACPTISDSFGEPEGKLDDEVDPEISLLRRSEYLLLRELLVLLRLWAGWAPSDVEESSAVSGAEADAAAGAWRDTLVGHDSACCALLLQAFTNGISLLDPATATNKTVSSPFGPRDVMSGEDAAETVIAAAFRKTDCDQPRHSIGGSHEKGERGVTVAEPGDEDVLIAAVEAARILRMLEARGAIRNIFASFYPSAVQVLHAFTRRLEKMQEGLLRTAWQGDRRRELYGSTHLTVSNEPEKLFDKEKSLCELELELKQQMQELHQHDLDLQQQKYCEESVETPDILQELGAAAPGFARHLLTNTDVADVTLSRATGIDESEMDARMRSNSQRDVAVTWLFQGALIKELLHSGAVAAMKEEFSRDATAEAYDFLMQVTPLLRVIPSLLTCWKQLESLDKMPGASFVRAAAVQVLQAGMQLLLRTSEKLAHALCSFTFWMSSPIDGSSRHDPLVDDNVPADLRHSADCHGSCDANEEETGNRRSTRSDSQRIRGSSREFGGGTTAVQQAAMKCWVNLVKPLGEILIGSADEHRPTAQCISTSPGTNVASPAKKTCRSEIARTLGASPKAAPGIAAAAAGYGGVPGADRCLEQEADAHRRSAQKGCDATHETGMLKSPGALFRVMKRMKDACAHKEGSILAKNLSVYALETGWTCLTSCCCSQCLPTALPENNMRTGCGKPRSSAKPDRPLWYRQWRGIIPATSESFAGTDVETHFAALSTIYNSCTMSAPRHSEGQVTGVTAALNGKPDLPVYANADRYPGYSAMAVVDEGLAEGENDSYYTATLRGISPCNRCDNTGGNIDRSVAGTKCIKNNAAVGARGSLATQWLPEDVEFFLSEASFLSTACCWVASSLHLLHHRQTYSCTCVAAAGLTGQVKPSRDFASGCDTREKEMSSSRRTCTPQNPNRRCRTVEQPLGGSDARSRSGSLRFTRPGLCAAQVTDDKHCNIFSPNQLKELAAAAAALACALRGALQYLFRELRWPRQSPSPYLAATKKAELSGGAASKTTPHPEAPWKQQQGQQSYHETQLPPELNTATRRQYVPENCGHHRARATSGPLLLFEPLAQLMLSLQQLLRACGPPTNMWNTSDEQSCLLAACSVAATPQTFLRALLLLYYSAKVSSLRETVEHSSFQQSEQVHSESHLPAQDRLWLKGAAQWYTMCCNASPPLRHQTAGPTAEAAGKITMDEQSVYEALVKATAAAQRGVPLEKQAQQTDAFEGVASPWVLCATDSLDVIVSKAEMQQKCFPRRWEKNGPACAGTPQRTHAIFSSPRLAVCPVDVAVGGGLWQCFRCDAALPSDHDATRPNSNTLPTRLGEAFSLCYVVLSTPNVARELSQYTPPGAVFAALVSLYAEPHLAGGVGGGRVSNSSSSRVQPHAAATGDDTKGASAFNIYARPGVYHLFCKLLDKLLLQPLGIRLRDHALRSELEYQLQSQKHVYGQVSGAHHQEKQMQGRERGRRLLYQSKRPHEREIEKDEQQGEMHQQENHQRVDRMRSPAPISSRLPPPSDPFYFSDAFLAVFSGVNQTESTVSLERLPHRASRGEPLAGVVLPRHCLNWFPVCCNKAHDVLVDHAARLLLISQNAAEAADPLLTLLLWLLSSPAFPFECRRMLLRGDQAWLKIGSQLFSFVHRAGGYSLQRPLQQFDCLRGRQQFQQAPHRIRGLPHQRQLESLQQLARLDCQLQQESSEEVNQQQEPGELQGRDTCSCLSRPALPAGDTSDDPAMVPCSEQQGQWCMQSPRGDVFWFTAPESLYVALPGMWSEESEEILAGWSSYVQDRLPKGLLLSGWHPTCICEQEAACCVPRGRHGATRRTSYIFALFPLHALALLVVDELNDLLIPLSGAPVTRHFSQSTRDQAQQQQQVSQGEFPFIEGNRQVLHVREGGGITMSHVARLDCPVLSSPLGHREASLQGSALPGIPRKAAGDFGQHLPVQCKEHADANSSELKRGIKSLMAPECLNESEAGVAQVADRIAHIIYAQIGDLIVD